MKSKIIKYMNIPKALKRAHRSTADTSAQEIFDVGMEFFKNSPHLYFYLPAA